MNMVRHDFIGKIAFVTGASAGMGAATGWAFAEAGAAVAIVNLDGGAAERFAAELNAAGHRALAVQCACPMKRERRTLSPALWRTSAASTWH